VEPPVPITPERVRSRALDVDAMLDEADAARRDGRLPEAATLLRKIATTHAADARAPSVWFMLGRVERRRGRHEAAAQAFRRAARLATSDALAEDALAEEATAWHDAGATQKAASAAERYLERWPSGTHAKRVQTIVR
jgi:cytochrome c-type biogenesis protein CcmH/NrfG